MRQRAITARRERLRELAEQEAAARCRQCKTPLERVRRDMAIPFCSSECEDDHLAFLVRWDAAKARVSR